MARRDNNRLNPNPHLPLLPQSQRPKNRQSRASNLAGPQADASLGIMAWDRLRDSCIEGLHEPVSICGVDGGAAGTVPSPAFGHFAAGLFGARDNIQLPPQVARGRAWSRRRILWRVG